MSANIPVLPIAAGTLVRALASLLALAATAARPANWPGLDRRMLADIGLTRADVRDAFSAPFWDDPTALLRARAIERRVQRAVTRAQRQPI